MRVLGRNNGWGGGMGRKGEGDTEKRMGKKEVMRGDGEGNGRRMWMIERERRGGFFEVVSGEDKWWGGGGAWLLRAACKRGELINFSLLSAL